MWELRLGSRIIIYELWGQRPRANCVLGSGCNLGAVMELESVLVNAKALKPHLGMPDCQ